jgi:hypothetical protein
MISMSMFRCVPLAVAALMATDGHAGQDARALMEASEQATKSRTEIARYALELRDAGGGLVQSRTMQFHYKRGERGESTLVRFESPSAIAGTGLLIEDQGLAANDIWLYLPATRRLRRIAGSEKTNWFMGTEFSHEDFEDYRLDLYRFERLDSRDCGEAVCDRIAAEPADPSERAASGYSRKVYWIDRDSLYPVRIEYFDRAGEPAKQLVASGLHQVDGYWRPQRIEMRNLGNGRSTRLIAQQRQMDVALDDYLVSSRFLRAD